MNSTDVLPCFESPSDAPTRRLSAGGRASGDQDIISRGQLLQKGKQTRTSSQNIPNAASQEERQFILLLLKRDPQAWQDFLGRYEKLIVSRVLSTCREFGIVPRPDLVEDCGAEVMATLFHGDMNGLRQFQGRSKLSTWLAVVARRSTITFLKRQQRETDKRCPNDSQFDIATIPEKTSDASPEADAENQRQLQICIRQLKQSDRLALELHFEQKMSYANIGRELGISENAVGPKLHRAQQRLKKLMEAG